MSGRKLSFSIVNTLVLLSLASYSQGCRAWREILPSENERIELMRDESAYLWLLSEEDFAQVTVVLEQRVRKTNFSLEVKNVTVATTIGVIQPTRGRQGVFQYLIEGERTQIGKIPVTNITLGSSSTIHYSVCRGPYTFLRPPSAFSSPSGSGAVSRAVLVFFLVVALSAAVGQTIYICYTKPWKESRDGFRVDHSKPLVKNLRSLASSGEGGRASVSSDSVYEEWNENWQMTGNMTPSAP